MKTQKAQKMKVLIGCEYSDVVASAFRAKGHEVISCDLEESKRGLALASFVCATMWLIIVILSAGTFDK